jgi:hypothetical protein
MFPSVAASPVQQQPGIVIQLPQMQPVANDSTSYVWAIVSIALMFALTVSVFGVILYRVRKLYKELKRK